MGLGKALKMNIVAEGVETLSQQDLLTELGCDSLQGYLLGRPVTATEFFDAAKDLTSMQTGIEGPLQKGY